MIKWKTLSLFLVVPCCFALLSGCSQSASENTPIEFFDISGGIDGKGTQIVEWGETATFNNDIYFKVKDGIDAKDLKVNYVYDEENVGSIQDLNVIVEYKGKEYKKAYTILVDDTHAPEITFQGDKKVMNLSSLPYDITSDLHVSDKANNRDEAIGHSLALSKFYPGYIVVYVPADDEAKLKEALDATADEGLDKYQVGKYKVVVRASDGHANISTKVFDLELTDELVYH